jgi:hypothetical protein
MYCAVKDLSQKRKFIIRKCHFVLLRIELSEGLEQGFLARSAVAEMKKKTWGGANSLPQ